MNFSDALTSYTAEIVDIMQEVRAKMQRAQEIKAEIDKLKQVETKPTKPTPNNIKISCECGCTINKSSWYSHIKTKKRLKKLEEVTKVKEVKPEVAKIVDTNDETDDDDDEIHDHYVDKEINKIKEIFYEGLFLRNYEHQKFLDISIRNAIHKNYKIHKKYKLYRE
jgi:hypothetical protein